MEGMIIACASLRRHLDRSRRSDGFDGLQPSGGLRLLVAIALLAATFGGLQASTVDQPIEAAMAAVPAR